MFDYTIPNQSLHGMRDLVNVHNGSISVLGFTAEIGRWPSGRKTVAVDVSSGWSAEASKELMGRVKDGSADGKGCRSSEEPERTAGAFDTGKKASQKCDHAENGGVHEQPSG